MTDKQENKKAMFIAVRDFIAANETDLSTLPSFASISEQFDYVVARLQSIGTKQETNIDGFALTKAEVKDALITQAYTLSKKLLVFAQLTVNTHLKSEIGYSKSELRYATDEELRKRCDIIYARANTYLEDLSEYKVTETAVEALQTQITAFSEAIPKPKNAWKNHKLITEQISTLLQEGDALLKDKIDIIMGMIEEEDINLYKAYRSARAMSNEYGSRKRAVNVKVTDSAGIPLRNVEATIVGSPITKKTSEKGGFQIDHMPAGVYTFNFSTTGYKPASATVIVRDGELARVNVVMESILENVGV